MLALALLQPLPAAVNLNAQLVPCVPTVPSVTANQAWQLQPHSLFLMTPTAAAEGPPSCPKLAQDFCCSSYDILKTGAPNRTLGQCCDLCHATARCVGIVLTTRAGSPGLTCYLKSALSGPRSDCGPGHCVTGTMGGALPPHRPAPPPPGPHPAPAPSPP